MVQTEGEEMREIIGVKEWEREEAGRGVGDAVIWREESWREAGGGGREKC